MWQESDEVKAALTVIKGAEIEVIYSYFVSYVSFYYYYGVCTNTNLDKITLN